MAYNLNALPDFVDQNRMPLLKEAILRGRTIDLINRQSGVKGKAALNIVDVTATLKDGRNCGFNPQGDDTFSQREIVTNIINVEKEWCWKKLIGKWTEYQMRNSIIAGDKKLDFEEFFTRTIVEKVQAELEKALWQGLVDGGTTLVDGFLKNFTDAGVTPITLSGATALEKVMEVYNAIPEQILDKAAIFVSASTFRSLVNDFVMANLFHYNPQAPIDELVLPGTNCKVYKVNGLNGAAGNPIVAADTQNLFYGFDVEDAERSFDIWYSKDNDTIRLRVVFNAGTQIAFPNEIVVGQ